MNKRIASWLDSDVGHSFRSSPVAMFAALIAFACLFCAVFANWVSPHDPFNLGAYCNPKLDEITKKIQSETDKTKRNELIKEAFKIHADDVGHLPLHQQSLAWGVSKKVELTQLADNFMFFKWMSIKAQQQP